jgi:RNA polymerase sigma-70 factor (ECF subfamily)
MDHRQDKDSQYFMQLFLKSQRRIYGYVMTMIPSPSEADDIVQDIAAVMWAKFGDYEPGTDFAAWAISIARFKVLRYLRDQQSHRRKFSQKTFDVIEKLESEETVNEDKRIEALRHCIQKLKETERRILSIRYTEGMTLKSLAQRLGLNVNTLYSRLSKNHLMLLNCIKKTMAQ